MTEEQKKKIRERMSWILGDCQDDKEFVHIEPSDNPDYFAVEYKTNKVTGETSIDYWLYEDCK